MKASRRLLLGCLLVFVACLSTTTHAASDSNLDSLLIRSIGGPAALDTVRAMTSFRAAGTVLLSGQPGQFTEIVVPPNKLYLEVSFNQYRIVQAFDGTIAWQRDLNGRVAELSGFEKKELIRSVYFETFAFVVPGRFPGEKVYAGDTTIGERAYHRVKFVPAGTDTVSTLFDAQTDLRFLTLSLLDNIATATTTENYRPVSRVLIPFSSQVTASNAPISLEFAIDSAAFNVPVDTSVFLLPVQHTADYHFPETASTIDIPFKYIAGHIYIPASINGKKKARFILDSGASATIFHSATIQSLELPVIGTMPTRGVGGFEEAQLVKTDSISIGSLSLYNQIGGSVDLSVLGNPGAEGQAFGGVLGYDFLSRFPVLVDYQRSALTVFNPDSFVVPSGGHEVPFELIMQVPTVNIEVAGVSGRFLVDLGNAFDLILHKPFVEQNGLVDKLQHDRSKSRTLGGIGGGVAVTSAIAPKVVLGDLTLTDVPVTISESSEGIAGSNDIAGNIGNELLERFKVLFDYQRQRVILYPTRSD